MSGNGHAGRLGVDATEHPSEASLVAQRVLARRERQELSDVGAADERLVAGAAEHQHADSGIVIEALTEIVEALVHLERHGVARASGRLKVIQATRPA